MRTHYCGQVNESLIGQSVTVAGWVHRRRDHGGVIFIDLRDREGLLQIVVDPDAAAMFAEAEKLRNEFVIRVTGLVRARRHQIIARTLGRGLGQHRRFDIDKTRVIQIVPHRTCQLMPLAQALIHDIAAQIEVAVFQPHFFRDVFVELERQGLGAVQRFDFAS